MEVTCIMRRKRKAIVLTLVTLCAAGCAQSDYKLSRDGKPMWHSVSAEQWRAASPAPTHGDFEAEPPKILPETHFAAGRLFESRGLLEKAIIQYKRAIAVNHQYAEAYHRLGVLLSMIGQRSEALGVLRRAVELQPDNAILRNDLGFEFVLSRRWTEAELRRGACELPRRTARGRCILQSGSDVSRAAALP
jgi:tetratricopeptide (TPR) repeat protein